MTMQLTHSRLSLRLRKTKFEDMLLEDSPVGQKTSPHSSSEWDQRKVKERVSLLGGVVNSSSEAKAYTEGFHLKLGNLRILEDN